MNDPSMIERITRSLAYMLRHQPEEFDLELDSHGFAELGEVVRALNERLGEAIEAEDVEEAVTSGDRARYEIVDDKIRALYGHSIEIDAGEPCKPPELLYAGVSSADAERALRHGLRPGRRRYLHLALDPEDARETGRRLAREYVVLTVRAIEAWEEGINFYDRRALYLSDPIPTAFLEIAERHSDGVEAERGFERSGGGSRYGRREGGDSHRGGGGERHAGGSGARRDSPGEGGRGRRGGGRGRGQGRGRELEPTHAREHHERREEPSARQYEASEPRREAPERGRDAPEPRREAPERGREAPQRDARSDRPEHRGEHERFAREERREREPRRDQDDGPPPERRPDRDRDREPTAPAPGARAPASPVSRPVTSPGGFGGGLQDEPRERSHASQQEREPRREESAQPARPAAPPRPAPAPRKEPDGPAFGAGLD